MRHEETFQSFEASSIEAVDGRQNRFFFANRVDRAVVGAFVCTQSSQPRASEERPKSGQEQPQSLQERPRAAQERQERPQSIPRAPQERPRAPQSAPRTPKSTPRTSQDCPRASQERQIEAARAPRSVQSTQIEATRATLTKHCPCAAKSTKTLPMRSRIDAQERPSWTSWAPSWPS